MAKLSLFERRRRRVRTALRNVSGGKPRLSVHRTGQHIYAQIIDDDSQKTVCAYNTRMKDFEAGNTWGMEAAEVVGKKIAEKALAAGVEKVCFDRSGFKYHGRIASVADGARACSAVSRRRLGHLLACHSRRRPATRSVTLLS